MKKSILRNTIVIAVAGLAIVSSGSVFAEDPYHTTHEEACKGKNQDQSSACAALNEKCSGSPQWWKVCTPDVHNTGTYAVSVPGCRNSVGYYCDCNYYNCGSR